MPERRFRALLLGWTLAAVAPAAARANAQQSDSNALVDRVWPLLAVLDAEHVDPPPTAALVAAGIDELESDLGVDLSAWKARIPGASDPDALRAFLGRMGAEAAGRGPATRVVNAMLRGISKRVPGGARVVDAEQAKVDDSLSGNRYVGVGVVLDFSVGLPVIRDTYHGGPAQRAGIRPGDVIYEVNGVDARGMQAAEFIAYSRDEPGTELEYVVGRQDSDERRAVRLIRGVVPRETVVGTERGADEQWIFALPHSESAYLKLKGITASTAHELRRAAERIRTGGLAGAVLDLRDCTSVEMHATALVADLFVTDGVMGASADRRTRTDYPAGPDALFDPAALVVLVNPWTRGTPEWLASTVQRAGAVVVGEETLGNPFLYSRVSVPGWPGEVRIATGRILDPGARAGRPRPMRGVTPDRTVESGAMLDEARLVLGRRSTESHPIRRLPDGPARDEESGAIPYGPVAMVSRGGRLCIACADGFLVVVDRERVLAERRVAASLSDLVDLGDGRTLAATDPVGGEVLLVRGSDGEVVDRRSVPAPASLVQAGDDLVVGSIRSRALTRLSLARTLEQDQGSVRFAPTPPATLELPFGPRALAWSGVDGRLLAADAYGGGLAVVDVGGWQLLGAREIAGHNIRGLLFTDEGRLLLAHQVLDPLATTSFDDVHWGNLVRNVVRELDVTDLHGGPVARTAALHHLGDAGHGAGDPSALLVDDRGRYVVTLAGTDELLIVDPSSGEERRYPVGRRPVAALAMDGGRVVAVANALDSSISFVDVTEGAVTTVALDHGAADRNGSERSLVERGRRLFFDARLSHDGWMSCHSCHAEGHSVGQLADTLGDDSYGTPKRVLSLLGVGATAPYGWNGGQPTLEAQIEKTLASTMHAEDIEAGTVAALAAFLRSLPAPTPREPHAAAESVERGRTTFHLAGCAECHVPPTFTSPDTYSVGLADEAGLGKFNPPSLRGVGSRRRLLHDGRFQSLEQLLARAGHPGTESLGADGIRDVTTYLRTL